MTFILNGTAVDRFWAKVVVPTTEGDECWVWSASTSEGYGTFAPNSSKQMVGAHRVSWALAHGEPPADDLVVCHVCDNPPCVRPSHLFLGTKRDNYRDAAAKGRIRAPRGAEHYSTSLTDDMVRGIRAAHTSGETQASIAARMGLNPATISLIVNRKRWTHVTDIPA